MESCDFCGEEFDNISGTVLAGEFRRCWKCRLKDIHDEILEKNNEIKKKQI